MEYSERATGLDGLRGMAAVMVVIYHAVNLCDLTVPTRVVAPRLADVPAADLPARVALAVFNAETAINIFFIVSGLLLSVSLRRERELDARTAARFAFRRVLRIYPALIVSVLAFGVVSYISLPALFSGPFVPGQMLLNSLLLETGVNGETWTLQAAMLLVPVGLLIAWLQRLFGAGAPAALLSFGVVCLFNEPPLGILILRGALPAFALGMLLATDPARLLASRLPAGLWAFCLIAVMLQRYFAFGGEPVALLVSLLLSAVAVAAIFYRTPQAGLLSSAPLRFLGRISYSLYLWHVGVMYTLFPWFEAWFGADRIAAQYLAFGLAYGAVVLAVAIPLAFETERAVERPAIAWGRGIASLADLRRQTTDLPAIRWLRSDGDRYSRSGLRYLRKSIRYTQSSLQSIFFGQGVGGVAVLLALFFAANLFSFFTIEPAMFTANGYALPALAGTSLLLVFLPLFVFARFGFGYLAGVSFYGVIAGFVWISYFSDLHYDHGLARLSAAASFLMFVLPLLFQTARLPRLLVLSQRSMDRMLVLALCLGAAVIVWNSRFGVAFVGMREGGELRGAFVRPAALNYINGVVVGAVLPFAFAWFAMQRRYAMAFTAIILLVLFYPVLLTKTVLLAAVWLPFVFLMFRTFEPKRATVLALLLPITLGVALIELAPAEGPIRLLAQFVFGYANIRMFAIPSIAMNYYSEFFASGELTGFCQITVVRAIVDCPYAEQLGPIFAKRYGVGNLNASLFSTEGIASVGPVWAPVSALVCGIIVSAANNVSARLPPAFVATSGALVLQALLNVPLSTALLTNGLLVLLLLWYVTPDMAEANARGLRLPDSAPAAANGAAPLAEAALQRESALR